VCRVCANVFGPGVEVFGLGAGPIFAGLLLVVVVVVLPETIHGSRRFLVGLLPSENPLRVLRLMPCHKHGPTPTHTPYRQLVCQNSGKKAILRHELVQERLGCRQSRKWDSLLASEHVLASESLVSHPLSPSVISGPLSPTAYALVSAHTLHMRRQGTRMRALPPHTHTSSS
jgi:hypothetical protein